MADHDQRFKHLVREFARDLLELFFPARAARLDFAAVEWLDKELFLDPPGGEKRQLDLVARVRVIPPSDDGPHLLLHLEVESEDRTTGLDERFPTYTWHLRQKYKLKVFPVAIFLRVGLHGLGERVIDDTTLDDWVMRHRYWYVGLPALNARPYLDGTNWLGVALSVLMKVPDGQRVKWAGEALLRLVQCPESPARKYLLVECLQAYAPLTAAERIELASLLQTPPYQGVQAVIKTIYEEGMEKGIEKGREEGREQGTELERRGNVERLLRRRFGPLGETARQRLARFPLERLHELFDAAISAASLQELGLED